MRKTKKTWHTKFAIDIFCKLLYNNRKGIFPQKITLRSTYYGQKTIKGASQGTNQR